MSDKNKSKYHCPYCGSIDLKFIDRGKYVEGDTLEENGYVKNYICNNCHHVIRYHPILSNFGKRE